MKTVRQGDNSYPVFSNVRCSRSRPLNVSYNNTNVMAQGAWSREITVD